MMNANSSSHNNLQFDKSNNPNHSNNTTDSNNPIYSHSHNLNDSNNVNHSNNPKDSNNSRNSHNCPSDSYNDSYNNIYNFHFHFPETPTSTYMNEIIQSFNTIPPSNASNDNMDIDAQIADAKEKLREGLLKMELADLYQELLLSSDEDTAEQLMEYQTEDKYPSFVGICNTMNNAMNNTNMDGDDITEEIVHDSEAKSEFLNDSYNIIYINNNENKNNENKNQPNTLQSPFKKNRKSHFKARHPPRPSHAEIDEMYNNMMDIKCNKCSKLMVHFVSSFDVYPKLKGWECDGVGCTEETGKLSYEEIYHCDCIEAAMSSGNELAALYQELLVSSDEDTAEPMECLAEIGMADEDVNSVEAESEELLNILPLQPRHPPSFEEPEEPQNNNVIDVECEEKEQKNIDKKKRKRKRCDLYEKGSDSLEEPPNKRRRVNHNGIVVFRQNLLL